MSEPASALTRAFLLPGMHGLDPGFERFASLCSEFVTLDLLDHPGLEAPVVELRDMRRAGLTAADAIEAACPEGPVNLVGYSFGGNVAYEAACVLVGRGRTIGMLVLLDVAFATTEVDLHGLAAARVRPEGVRFDGRVVATRFFSRVMSLDEVRRGVGRVCDLLPGNHPHGARRRLVAFLRMEAVYDWVPNPLDVPGALVLSGQFAAAVEAGWRDLAPSLRVSTVPGRHVDLFLDPSISQVTSAVRDAVAVAMTEATP